LPSDEEVHQQIDAMLARLRKVREAQKQPTTSGTAKKDELVLRVYALWQVAGQRARHAESAQASVQSAPAAVANRAESTDSVLRQTPSVGKGGQSGFGGVPEQYFDATPPPGVPAKEAAELIRWLVAPDTWNKPGVMLQPASHRLLISQSRAHRKIAELAQLDRGRGLFG
jgi:hypothetical protein